MSNAEHQGRQLERFESQLQNKDILRVLRIDQTMIQVSWWSGGNWTLSYHHIYFTSFCFQLFPIIRILTRLINELQLRIGLVMDFKSFFVFCCGALEFLQFLSMQSESLMAALVWRSFLATECYYVIPGTPQIKVPAKFSNHTRHSPMHSITDQHSTLKIHPRFPYPCFAAFLQLGFASVLLGCLHLMQHLWISRVSWQTFWPSSCASILMTRIIFHLHGCTRRSVEVIAAAALFMQLLSIDSCL